MKVLSLGLGDFQFLVESLPYILKTWRHKYSARYLYLYLITLSNCLMRTVGASPIIEISQYISVCAASIFEIFELLQVSLLNGSSMLNSLWS